MTLSTWNLLKSLGFEESQCSSSIPDKGLGMDFGNFKLEAAFMMNRWFQEAVFLLGQYSNPRTIGLVEQEMPTEVESWEQGVAWVTWCLDTQVGNGKFNPDLPVDWLEKGRKFRWMLPWERERAEYDDRPLSLVQRDWARVGLQKLAKLLERTADESPVVFQFTGEVLMIRCEGELIAMPARGDAWPSPFSIKASALRTLPRRLRWEHVEFSILDGTLIIGNKRYIGAVTVKTI